MKTEVFRAFNASVSINGRPVLQRLNLYLHHGETIGIFGTYDSGNPTLIDMITGDARLQSGTLYYNDVPYGTGGINYQGANVARISGTSALIDGMQLWENILVLRKDKKKKIFLNQNLIIKEMEKRFNEYQLDFDPHQLTEMLTPTQHIIIEILRAHLLGAKIIVISDFSIESVHEEYRELFLFIEKLKSEGTSFIVTSYRITNLKMFCDRILLMTKGSIVKSVVNIPNENGKEVDRILSSIFPEHLIPQNNRLVNKDIIFQAKNIDIGLNKPFSFDLRKGEIVAFVDPLMTSNNILEAKLRTCDKSSTFLLYGKQVKKIGWNENAIFIDFNTRDMIFTRLPIINNICFTSYPKYSSLGIIRHRLCKFVSDEFIQWYGDDSMTEMPYSKEITEKQRIAILLFRLRLANPAVLFCLDPGIDSDFISNQMIHKELAEFAEERGMAIFILVSSKENMNNFADRYIMVSRDNIIEGIDFKDIPNASDEINL